jgi:hypothetical protein
MKDHILPGLPVAAMRGAQKPAKPAARARYQNSSGLSQICYNLGSWPDFPINELYSLMTAMYVSRDF